MDSKSWQIHVVQGPNLNLLEERDPNHYGGHPMGPFLDALVADFPQVEFRFFQSNIEGELIDYIQGIRKEADGLILNAGGYAHTSVALGDCLALLSFPVIEVHLSHVYAREAFRRESPLAPHVLGSISGLGLLGYRWAVHHLLSLFGR